MCRLVEDGDAINIPSPGEHECMGLLVSLSLLDPFTAYLSMQIKLCTWNLQVTVEVQDAVTNIVISNPS